MEIVDRSDHRLIRLAGRLAETQVYELRNLCADKGVVIQLHLGELISVDTIGLEALYRLRCGGVELLEVPAYIQFKLDSLSTKRAPRRS